MVVNGFRYVLAEKSCGKYFDFGVVDGACDCVPQSHTECQEADAENYHVSLGCDFHYPNIGCWQTPLQRCAFSAFCVLSKKFKRIVQNCQFFQLSFRYLIQKGGPEALPLDSGFTTFQSHRKEITPCIP